MNDPRQPALVTLRAGDKVLVLLNDDPDTEDLMEIADALHRHHEGVEFTVLSNVAGVLVQPPGPESAGPKASRMWADADTPDPPEAA